ncbi:MAG: hypothetical protein CME70_13160 [Halobacteriovorax sp.]|nr:hypothetical protein [Halobacteriovorax sp.]
MRALIILTFFLCQFPSLYSKEKEVLEFSSKNYFFQTSIENNTIEIIWNKSGFKNKLSKKMAVCFEKSIRKEIDQLGKSLLSSRGKHNFGIEAAVKWKSWKDRRKLYPREMDKLDKRFSYIFTIANKSESKCIK